MSNQHHAKDVPLLYTKALSEWNEIRGKYTKIPYHKTHNILKLLLHKFDWSLCHVSGNLGFPPRVLCGAKTYLDCSLPVCPWVNTVYEVKQSVVTYTEHCSKQNGHLYPYRLNKHPILIQMLQNAEFGGVVRGTADYVCFTFVKNRILIGVIVNEKTADFIGVFEFPLVEPTVCQLWHLSMSHNQLYVGLLVHMKPNLMSMNHLNPEEFDIYLFEACDRRDSLWLYKQITCIESLKSDLEGGLRSVIISYGSSKAHACLLVPCWAQQDQHHAMLYDVSSTKLIARSANLFRYFPVEGEPILKVQCMIML